VSAPEYDFAVLGAGAMGSIVGGHLARAGHKVAMLARGARAAQLEAQGIRIRGLSEFATPVQPLRDPAQLHSAAVLIVATKTPGTAEALAPLRSARIGVALSLQNGTLKDELLRDAFGAERVLGALADTSGELLAGGEVLFTRNVSILIGELAGGESARASVLAQTLDAAGVRAAATPEILTLEWSKFCSWVGLIALAVSTRLATWRFLSDPDAALVLVRLVREMGRLAAALGISLSDRAILPTASLCSGSEPEAVALVMQSGARYRAHAPQHRMSALQDVENGRALEVHETFGDALAKARALGLELPLLECCTLLLAAIDRTRSPHT
jgi:2-dehydropantoate 2-reductase